MLEKKSELGVLDEVQPDLKASCFCRGVRWKSAWTATGYNQDNLDIYGGLNKNNQYFYQVQKQMFVAGKDIWRLGC